MYLLQGFREENDLLLQNKIYQFQHNFLSLTLITLTENCHFLENGYQNFLWANSYFHEGTYKLVCITTCYGEKKSRKQTDKKLKQNKTTSKLFISVRRKGKGNEGLYHYF